MEGQGFFELMVDDVNKGFMLFSNIEKSDIIFWIVFRIGIDMFFFRFLICYYKLIYCYKIRKLKLQLLGLRFNMFELEWRILKYSKFKKLICLLFNNLRVVLYCLVNYLVSFFFLVLQFDYLFGCLDIIVYFFKRGRLNIEIYELSYCIKKCN